MELPRSSPGIYVIKNNINGKMYIGQSINLYNRWMEHKYKLSANKHENSYLQNAWNKYSKKNFEFKELELCDIENLNTREIYWIDFYKTTNRSYGYNLESGGSLQKTLSEETKRKIGEAGKGRICKEETRYKISLANSGKKRSDEYIENFRIRNIGNKYNEGRKYTDELRNKLSNIAKISGRIPPSRKGCTMSEEGRQKISMSHKRLSNRVHITNEMINDVINKITIKQFKVKYNYGRDIWRRCKNMIEKGCDI